MMRVIIVVIMLPAALVSLAGGDNVPKPYGPVPAKEAVPAALATVGSDWHGYQKQSFTLAGLPAFVVVPKN